MDRARPGLAWSARNRMEPAARPSLTWSQVILEISSFLAPEKHHRLMKGFNSSSELARRSPAWAGVSIPMSKAPLSLARLTFVFDASFSTAKHRRIDQS